MDVNKVNISQISLRQLKAYTCFIRADDIPFILNGYAYVFGIDDLNDGPVGAAVVETAPEPDAGPGQILLIRHLYLKPQYTTFGVTEQLVDRVCDEAVKRYMSGVAVQIEYPDDPVLENYAADRFSRIEDGNTVYELDVDSIYDHPAFKRTGNLPGGSVRRVSDLSVYEMRSFKSEWKDHFPKGLSYDRLPGKWLKDLSFVYQKDDGFSGYVLTSELSEERLYVGAVYSDPGQPLVSAVLVAALGRKVILDTDYRKAVFAAASYEGKKFCDKMLKGIYSIKKWEIHYYYLEV